MCREIELCLKITCISRHFTRVWPLRRLRYTTRRSKFNVPGIEHAKFADARVRRKPKTTGISRKSRPSHQTRWETQNLAEEMVRLKERVFAVLEVPKRRQQEATGSNHSGRCLQVNFPFANDFHMCLNETSAFRINRAEGAATFEISTGKKTYYLTADCIATMEDWIRVLQNVQRRNATKLLLSREDNKPTIQGWLTKVKNGHAKKCYCVLIGKMFLYFKCPNDTVLMSAISHENLPSMWSTLQTPIGQINMRDARVEEVEHVSDSDSEERDSECLHEQTIGIFPTHQGPTYLLMPHKQEKDNWLYHLTVVSDGGPSAGTTTCSLLDPPCSVFDHCLGTQERNTSN